MRHTLFTVAVLAVLQPTMAVADGLTVTGSFRARGEAIAGQARAGFNDTDEILALRSTLKALYRRQALTFGIEIYDSRVYGAVAGSAVTSNDVNVLEPVQAFVEYDAGSMLAKGSSLKLKGGRMLLDIASRRLVADDDYRNTTSSFTGVRADFQGRNGLGVTAFAVLPQLRLPDDGASLRRNSFALDHEGFDTALWAVVLSRPGIAGTVRGEFGYYGLAERDRAGRSTRDRHLHTLTARLVRDAKVRHFDAEVEVMGQFGTVSASTAVGAPRLPVAAWFAHARAGYTFDGHWQPRVAVEVDSVSGDRGGGTYGRFDTLYGMRRAELGVAGLYNSVGRANMTAVGIKAETTAVRRIDFLATARALWLQSGTDAFSTTGVRDATGRSGSYAGLQFDNRIRWWLVPRRLRAEVDGTLLLKGEFLRNAPNAPRNGDTRYLAIALSAFF